MLTISGTPPAGQVGVAYAFTPTVTEEADAGTGPIIAVGDQRVTVPSLAGSSAAGTGLPLGALAWPRPLDPYDLAPYAVDLSALLGGARIASVLAITMSAAGAAVGVTIASDAARAPIIDEVGGQVVQLWLSVDAADQASASFAGSGLQVGVSVRVQTDADPYQTYERTAVLTVRRL